MRPHQDPGSQQILGIHFGGVQLTWEAIDDPLKDLTTALTDQGLPANTFWVLEPGAAAIPSGGSSPKGEY